MSKIDFVIYWVDGKDPKWIKKKNEYSDYKNDLNEEQMVRYREWDNLEIWIQSVYKFAPWVNKIFIITDNQKQSFFDNYDKVISINHSDYIPQEFLPTYSSHTIELNLHRIMELSEQFVVFNDDVFLLKPTKPTDFFKNNMPLDVYAINAVSGIGNEEVIHSVTLNNASLINKHFNKRKQIIKNFWKWFNLKNGIENIRTLLLLPWPYFTGFYEPHICNAFLKSTLEEVWTKEKDVLYRSSLNKHRDAKDVNQWLFKNWQLAKGITKNRSVKFGKMFTLTDDSEQECISWIKHRKSTVVCINDYDAISNFEQTKKNINDALCDNLERG